MTVSSTDNKAVFVGDGVTTVFSYTYVMFDDAHMQPFLGATVQTSGFTVAREPDDIGGTVTFDTAPTVDIVVTLLREVPQVQNTDYQPYDAFPAETHERGLDTLTLITQQLQENIDRAIIASVGSPSDVSYELPPYDAGKSVVWSASDPKQLENSTDTIESNLAAAAASAAASEASRQASGVSAANSQNSAVDSALQKTYSEEWAQKAEDVPVSVAAGGDGSTEFSALHHSAKSSGFADASEASADASEASAAASEASRIASGVSADESAASAEEAKTYVKPSTVVSRNSVQNQDPVSQGTASRAGFESLLGTATSGVTTTGGDFGGLEINKDRNNATSWIWSDSVMGDFYLSSDTTAAEVATVPAVNADDVTYTIQTTEKTTGTTNRNKAFTTHYNSDLGFSITGFDGDATDGHEIPHYLGKEPELVIWKNRDVITSWEVLSPYIGNPVDGDFLVLNTTAAINSSVSRKTIFSDETISLGSSSTVNGSAANMIAYAFTSIPNVCEINTYTGTGAAGNYVKCGFKPAWVLVKQLGGATSWAIYDGSRGGSFYLLADSSAAEGSAAILGIEFVDDGFVLLGSSAVVNSLNGQYIFMAYAEGTAFDGTKTLTNYDYATTDEVLTINEGTLMSFAEGFNANGQVDTQELVGAGVTLSFGTGFENQTRYVYKDKASTYDSTIYRPLEGTSRAQADKFGVVSPLDATTRTTDKHFGYESATGVALASTERTDRPAWQAFNNDTERGSASAFGWAANTVTTGTLQYKSIEPRVLKSYRFMSPSMSTTPATNLGTFPIDFTVDGSNDGLSWTAIDTVVGYTPVGDGTAGIWEPLVDTSANTTTYIYYRFNITANNGGTTVALGQLEFNTITPSDYYNVVDGLVYNNAGTVIDRVYLAKVNTGASGEILNYENLPVAKTKGVSAEYQGKLTVHDEISNRGICTAWAVVDGTTNPPTILDSENFYDIPDYGAGLYGGIFETPMDNNAYSVSISLWNTGTGGASDLGTATRGASGGQLTGTSIPSVNSFRFETLVSASSTGNGALNDFSKIFVQVFGGKNIV